MAVCSALHSWFEFKVKFRETRGLTPFPQGHSTGVSHLGCAVFLCLERQLREPTQEHWC